VLLEGLILVRKGGKDGKWESGKRKGEGRGENETGGKRRGPQRLVHTSMSKILKNTRIAELI